MPPRLRATPLLACLGPAAAIALAAPLPALAQPLWAGEVQLVAYSRTAEAITGDIALSGPEENRILTTASGAVLRLVALGETRAVWDLMGGDATAGAVYRLDADPGALLNGNRLCAAPATFAVFSESRAEWRDPLVQIAVFSGAQPQSIADPGLCGTFNYAAE